LQPRGSAMAPMGDIYFHPDGGGWSDDFAAEPLHRQGFFIHELTHVWQIQHRSLEDGYVPGWLCEGIAEKTKGKKAYEPGPPGPPFRSFGIEGQASIVDRWFAGKKGGKPLDPGNPLLTAMDESSRYFGYISDNIRLGVS